MSELSSLCKKWDITLCGGHTEITDAVTRPVVTGMMAGTVRKENLKDKRNIKQGDMILLTKSVAVEGTSIIAREFGSRLKSLGMSDEEIKGSRDFLSKIGIIDEARIAAGYSSVTAMHDVTEGGLATALSELSHAGGHRIRIDMEKISFYEETEKMCSLLGIDPLGLIGSGSLLITCDSKDLEPLINDIKRKDIEVACIGEVLHKGEGIEAFRNGAVCSWPEFSADELTRLF